MTQPLANLTVLNTRPEAEAKKLADFIQAMGGNVINIPALTITPLTVDWTKLAWNECTYAIFISPSAARLSLPSLKKYWSTWPKVAVMGKATQRLFQLHSLEVDFIPAAQNSESLLEQPQFQAFTHESFFIFKGQGGRQLLTEALRLRGARVYEIDVYRRDCPKKIAPLAFKQWNNQTIDIILGTSVTSVHHLFQMLGNDNLERLQKTTWLVISERVKEAALSLGVTHCVVASQGDIYSSLLQLKNQEESDG